MAYCKIHLYTELLESDLPEDPYLAHDLERYFPAPLPERYGDRMRDHRLRREIIATVVANQLVDRAGTTFAFRLGEETGAPPSILARAFAVAREVFEMRVVLGASRGARPRGRRRHAALDADRRAAARRTRDPMAGTRQSGIDRHRAHRRPLPARGAWSCGRAIPDMLDAGDRAQFDLRLGELLAAGVGEPLARRVASMPSMLPAVRHRRDRERHRGAHQTVVTETFFAIGARLKLNWLRDRIIELPRDNRWQALARAALRDDLNTLVPRAHPGGPRGRRVRTRPASRRSRAWEAGHGAAVERCLEHARRHPGLRDPRHDDAARRPA